jgi:proteasome lid subunit RPN8/RPN11
MLQLTPQLKQDINAHGAQAYPYEGCGLLLGQAENGRNLVTALYPVENRWEVEEEKRVRFLITPADMLQAELAAAGQGLDVIGIFHSHPDDVPVASPRDLAWATWPGYSYLITEIRAGRPGISRSWQLREDRTGFVEEEIVFSEVTSKP